MGDKSAFVGIVTKLFDITGKALSGEWGTDDLDGCGIPVLRTTNFTNVGKVNYDNVVTRNIQKQNISEKLLKKGDIIIEKSGGTDKNPVGRVIYFEGEENKYLFNNFTGLLRVKDKNEWYPKYVFYSMFAYYKRGGTRRFENKTTGLHNLKLDDYIKRLDIQKASYVDQVHVCKLLDCVRLQIDNMEQELELLDELVKARFVEMFGDVQDAKKHRSIQLKDICNTVTGGTPSTKHVEYYNGTIPWISTVSLGPNYIDGTTAKAFITQEAVDNSSTKIIPSGSILFGTRVGVGKSSINQVEMCTNQDIVAIIDLDESKYNKLYIKYVLDTYQSYFDSIKKGATILGISSDDLKNIYVPDASLYEQDRFEKFVKQIDKSRSRIQKSLEASQELFDSLMQEYFS